MEAVMKRWWVWLLLVFSPAICHADGVLVWGAADKEIPAWAVSTQVPDDWTDDCCMYAKAIGVNLVLYQGEWTGEPERVMVLNVWTSKLSSLEAELQDDRHRYLGRDPAAKAQVLAVNNSSMPCRGVHYQGSDHKDDLVAFCDPGLATGIRLSWSMSLAHDDPKMSGLVASFQRVVEQSAYLKYTGNTNGKGAKAGASH
jgi:hypothetical protein